MSKSPYFGYGLDDLRIIARSTISCYDYAGYSLSLACISVQFRPVNTVVKDEIQPGDPYLVVLTRRKDHVGKTICCKKG